MSLVYITRHNESVYQYQEDKKSDQPLAKPGRARGVGRKLKKPSKIKDGKIEKEILKETETDTKRSESKQPEPKPSSSINKEVGRKSGMKEKKNSVKSGCAIKYVYTRNGDTKSVIHSGLVPVFRMRPSFGSVPEYLQQIKHYISVHSNKERKDPKDSLQNRKIKSLTAEERLNILDGLKTRWRMLQEKLQLLPVITDTIPKNKRKGDLLRLIMQLEKDIFFVESNPTIYVVED